VDGPQWVIQRKTASHLFSVQQLRYMATVAVKHGYEVFYSCQYPRLDLDLQNMSASIGLSCTCTCYSDRGEVLEHFRSKQGEVIDVQDLFHCFTLDTFAGALFCPFLFMIVGLHVCFVVSTETTYRDCVWRRYRKSEGRRAVREGLQYGQLLHPTPLFPAPVAGPARYYSRYQRNL
jgi:hypothetical protein